MTNPVLTLMREDDLKGDPWGTAMAWGFAVCEVLYAAGEVVPGELDFRPSPLVRVSDAVPEEWPDSDVWHLLHRTEGHWVEPGYGASVAELQAAARVLARYLDVCLAAGLGY